MPCLVPHTYVYALVNDFSMILVRHAHANSHDVVSFTPNATQRVRYVQATPETSEVLNGPVDDGMTFRAFLNRERAANPTFGTYRGGAFVKS